MKRDKEAMRMLIEMLSEISGVSIWKIKGGGDLNDLEMENLVKAGEILVKRHKNLQKLHKENNV